MNLGAKLDEYTNDQIIVLSTLAKLPINSLKKCNVILNRLTKAECEKYTTIFKDSFNDSNSRKYQYLPEKKSIADLLGKDDIYNESLNKFMDSGEDGGCQDYLLKYLNTFEHNLEIETDLIEFLDDTADDQICETTLYGNLGSRSKTLDDNAFISYPVILNNTAMTLPSSDSDASSTGGTCSNPNLERSLDFNKRFSHRPLRPGGSRRPKRQSQRIAAIAANAPSHLSTSSTYLEPSSDPDDLDSVLSWEPKRRPIQRSSAPQLDSDSCHSPDPFTSPPAREQTPPWAEEIFREQIGVELARLRASRLIDSAAKGPASSESEIMIIDIGHNVEEIHRMVNNVCKVPTTMITVGGPTTDDGKDTPGNQAHEDQGDKGTTTKADCTSKRRRNIRKIRDDLNEETRKANEAELERIERIKDNRLLRAVYTEEDLILESEIGDNGAIKVQKVISQHLKPHQVRGIKFLYENLIESRERILAGDPGNGAILAHLMGLGKTLQVIALVHTLLTSPSFVGLLKTCLIICPQNTCLNWMAEIKKWTEPARPIKYWALCNAKTLKSRWTMLNDWIEHGGLLLIGYDMFRLLVAMSSSPSSLLTSSDQRSSSFLNTVRQTLQDPGPSIMVCDEGHMLKNSSTAIFKAVNRVRTRRRVILTGTPLQNNLYEYHCMVQLVRKNILGTRSEFQNAFVNPIKNGQCVDSTDYDVKIMRKRAHVLHQKLTGCVQRVDYSVFTHPTPKYEYVILVRLSPLQCEMYRHYLDLLRQFPTRRNFSNAATNSTTPNNSNFSVFADYTNLYSIITHPWLFELTDKKRRMIADNKAISDALTVDREDVTFGIPDTLSALSNHSSASCSEDLDALALLDYGVIDLVGDDDSTEYSSVVREPRGKSGREWHRPSGDFWDPIAGEVEAKGFLGTSDTVDCRDTGPTVSVARKADIDFLDDMDYQYPVRSSIDMSSVIPKRAGNQGEGDRNYKWWETFLASSDRNDVWLSGKIVLVLDILKESEVVGDKVQSLSTLDFLERVLAAVHYHCRLLTDDVEHAPDSNDYGSLPTKRSRLKLLIGGWKYGTWQAGTDYFRMDGSTSISTRQRYTQAINDTSSHKARFFLISTKSGSLGVNLTGANRVIIFDACWNPSHDIQAIFRTYRLGQTKPVYIYRLISQGTIEERIYERQVTKLSLSQRVVDKRQIERYFTGDDLEKLYNFDPIVCESEESDDDTRPRSGPNHVSTRPKGPESGNVTASGKRYPLPNLPKDLLLASILRRHKSWIVTYHDHDSLLENKDSEELTEEERRAAWAEYEYEMAAPQRSASVAPPHTQSFLSLVAPSGSSFSLNNIPHIYTTNNSLSTAGPSLDLNAGHFDNLRQENPSITLGHPDFRVCGIKLKELSRMYDSIGILDLNMVHYYCIEKHGTLDPVLFKSKRAELLNTLGCNHALIQNLISYAKTLETLRNPNAPVIAPRSVSHFQDFSDNPDLLRTISTMSNDPKDLLRSYPSDPRPPMFRPTIQTDSFSSLDFRHGIINKNRLSSPPATRYRPRPKSKRPQHQQVGYRFNQNSPSARATEPYTTTPGNNYLNDDVSLRYETTRPRYNFPQGTGSDRYATSSGQIAGPTLAIGTVPFTRHIPTPISVGISSATTWARGLQTFGASTTGVNNPNSLAPSHNSTVAGCFPSISTLGGTLSVPTRGQYVPGGVIGNGDVAQVEPPLPLIRGYRIIDGVAYEIDNRGSL